MKHFPLATFIALAGSIVGQAATATIPDNQSTSIPLYFEPNLGQTDPNVRFLAWGPGFMAWITDHELILRQGRSGETTRIGFAPETKRARSTKGVDKQIGTSAYFIGNEERKWVRNVPSYAKALIEEVYPGIDVVFYAGKGKHAIEYDFVVKSGADPSQISIDFDPVQKPRRDALGIISLNNGQWTHEIPMVHQGLQQVAYKSNFDGRSLRFQIGEYDRSKSLIIDPALAFSTYLGGSGSDQIQGVAVDSSNAVYVSGNALSTNFPFVNPGAPAPAQTAYNVFATKFGPTPVQGVRPRIYSIYFGTNDRFQLERPVSIAVDRNGAAYIATTNQTLNMPVRNAAQPNWNGEIDGWAAKISATAGASGYEFEYGTYIGGSGGDTVTGIAVDSDGAAYVTGTTFSPNFPVSNSQHTARRGFADAFVIKIAARPRTGSNVFHYVYALLHGGSAGDQPSSIAVDSTGAAYIAGQTSSRDLPLARALQTSNNSTANDITGFIAKFSATPDATTGVYALAYSTYLGGTNEDRVTALAIDGAGNAYLTGWMNSSDFPKVRPMNPYAPSRAFVAKIGGQSNSAGVHPLLFSSTLPGSIAAKAIAVDSAGAVYVGSNPFTESGPRLVDPALIYGTGANGHVLKLSIPDTGDASVLYSTAAGPLLNALAVDAAGTAYVGGETGDRTVPVVQGNASTTPSAPNDGYLMALSSGPSSFTVVIQANRNNIPFQVSGPAACNPGTYQAPAAFSWPSGTQCTVQPQALVSEETYRHQFLKWDDNNSTTATRTITAGAGSQTYLLNYDRYWRVRIDVSATDGTVTPGPISFFLEGTTNTLTATPATGKVFFRWEGGPFSGRATSPVINTRALDGSVELTARFVPAYTAQSPLQFLPLTPCRLADTRFAEGPTITGKTVREFTVTGKCGVPVNATAFSLNVTVIPKGALGFLTLFPTGQPQPTVSTLNSLDGRIKANSAIIRAGTGGKVSVYVTDDSDVVLDINGAFMPPGALTLAYYPVTPCRVLDTRQPFGGGRLAALTPRTLEMQRSLQAGGCITAGQALPYLSARAYALNVTVVPTARLGYLRIQPTGAPSTETSTLNALTGTIVANQAIVPAGTNGAIDMFATDSTDVIVDIHGFFAPADSGAGGLNFYPVNPCRSLDSRTPGNPPDSRGPLNGYVHSVGPNCPAVPVAARAYSANVTAIPAEPLPFQTVPFLGYLSIRPADASSGIPQVSLLNALDGAITNNASIIEGSPDLFSIFATHLTHVLIDVNGFFAQ